MGSALPYPDFADNRSTTPAGSALTTVDADDKTAGLEDAIDIGSPGINRFLQHRNNGGMQSAYVAWRKF